MGACLTNNGTLWPDGGTGKKISLLAQIALSDQDYDCEHCSKEGCPKKGDRVRISLRPIEGEFVGYKGEADIDKIWELAEEFREAVWRKEQIKYPLIGLLVGHMKVCPLSIVDDPVCFQIWDAYSIGKELHHFPIPGCEEHPAFVEGVKIIMGKFAKALRKPIKKPK